MQVHHNVTAYIVTACVRPFITHYDYTQSSFRFQYRLLTMTTFFETAVLRFLFSVLFRVTRILFSVLCMVLCNAFSV